MMEQRLIDANKLVFEEIEGDDGDYYDVVYSSDIYNASVVMTIPDNVTNGDMIKAMFPNCVVIDEDFWGAVITNIDNKQYWSKEWWNAPYKRGTE